MFTAGKCDMLHLRLPQSIPSAAGAPGPTRDVRLESARTQREMQNVIENDLAAKYGPYYKSLDVRLFLKKRQLNQKRDRKAGFPPDDSFDKPETFFKFSTAFQQVICSFIITINIDSLQAVSCVPK